MESGQKICVFCDFVINTQRMQTIPRLLQMLLCFTFVAYCMCAANDKQEPKTVLFFGDSLTAGYGIDPGQAYPALIEHKLVGENLPWKVSVGAVSGDTSAGGLRRIAWALRQSVDIFVLALGSNDGLRGIPLESTEANLQAIIDKVKAKNPGAQIVIAGMLMPPNLGPEYTRQFEQLYPRLAKTNNAVLIPFLLKDVAGHPALNLPDGIHPTPEGHAIMAETVWEKIGPLVKNPATEGNESK